MIVLRFLYFGQHLKVFEETTSYLSIPAVESDNVGLRADDFFIEQFYEVPGSASQQLTEEHYLLMDGSVTLVLAELFHGDPDYLVDVVGFLFELGGGVIEQVDHDLWAEPLPLLLLPLHLYHIPSTVHELVKKELTITIRSPQNIPRLAQATQSGPQKQQSAISVASQIAGAPQYRPSPQGFSNFICDKQNKFSPPMITNTLERSK